MSRGVFITGTDTSVGKTLSACGLLRGLSSRGMIVSGYKPVAAGADLIDGRLQNDDATWLARCSSGHLDYDEVNPIVLEPPIAPHIAASAAGLVVDLKRLVDGHQRLAEKCDFVVSEGAGGWLVPLNDELHFSDLAVALGVPVVLVVGLRLGCLNHALLTAESIDHHGARLVGWIANTLEPGMAALEENLETLERSLDAPLIGSVPWLGNESMEERIGRASASMNLGLLLHELRN